MNAISTIEQQLRELVTKRLEGAKIRSRASWLEKGERPTSFFFNLEQTKQKQAAITKLTTAKTLPKTLHGRGGRRINTKMVP